MRINSLKSVIVQIELNKCSNLVNVSPVIALTKVNLYRLY